MNVKQRVEALENNIGMSVVSLRFSFGAYDEGCKHYQNKSCLRAWKNQALPLPEGAKIQFITAPQEPSESEPCHGCTIKEA
jgi:hypothetical protein